MGSTKASIKKKKKLTEEGLKRRVRERWKNPSAAERRAGSDPTLFSTNLYHSQGLAFATLGDTHFETRAPACLSSCSKVPSSLALLKQSWKYQLVNPVVSMRVTNSFWFAPVLKLRVVHPGNPLSPGKPGQLVPLVPREVVVPLLGI